MSPANSDFAANLIGLMVVRRYGNVDEIAGFASYLAGSEAAYITGASFLIDGGFAA
ncbi:SDR family oxidoreductase [Undibacterium danionis]|uniref:SDR family oxidoreductase n=1 Tax=Undibacterium danionis TaxID=1812100 RepID=A0ABV6ICC2_9BURK